MTVNNQLSRQLGEIECLIGPSLEAMGFRLVRVALKSALGGLNLQVMAEPLDNTEMNVDQCADLSRAISAILDVEDPILDAYTLEVSSPGIERPLVRHSDFSRFSGYQVRIETVEPQYGRRRFVGRLCGLDEDQVILSLSGSDKSLENLAIPFENICRAKLMLTDELIQDTLKKRKTNG